MKKLFAVLMILVLVSVVACMPPKEMLNQQNAGTESAAVEDVTGDLDAVSAVEDDLDTSSMDTLDQDMAEITW